MALSLIHLQLSILSTFAIQKKTNNGAFRGSSVLEEVLWVGEIAQIIDDLSAKSGEVAYLW